jgi:hypothetical protein
VLLYPYNYIRKQAGLQRFSTYTKYKVSQNLPQKSVKFWLTEKAPFCIIASTPLLRRNTGLLRGTRKRPRRVSAAIFAAGIL